MSEKVISPANSEEQIAPKNDARMEYKTEIVYSNVLKLTILHISTIYGFYLNFTTGHLITKIYTFGLGNVASMGIIAGAHRLWSHRSYKAKLPLRIFLCIGQTIAVQNSIYEWVRDHRVHHKFTETDADPHNIKRGFFFAHMGWLMCKKHPQVKEKGKNIYLDDLLDDPVVTFQKRFYFPLIFVFGLCLPIMIPVLCWNETVWNSFFFNMARYALSLHYTWLVNSAAHMFGDRPFDKKIHATDNLLIAYLTNGGGWHNYHHAFPWDYASSELGYRMNVAKIFIDGMAKIGQAYDLKTANPHVARIRKLKRGDGSRLDSDGDRLSPFSPTMWPIYFHFCSISFVVFFTTIMTYSLT